MEKYHMFLQKCIVLVIAIFCSYSLFLPQFLSADVVNLTVCIQGVSNSCTITPPSPPPTTGGSGGGGAVGGFIPPMINEVIFKGKAYPLNNVHLLQDGEQKAITESGPDANFEIDLSGLSSGTYTFGVWADDNGGNHSITQTFTLTINAGVTTVISGIILPPTIAIDKSQVKKGDLITVFGQTIPLANVGIQFHSQNPINASTTADNLGTWLYKMNTLSLDYGSHTVQAYAQYATETTDTSETVHFIVGSSDVPNVTGKHFLKGDLNNDGKVNLIDFSIAAYWYNRPLNPAMLQIEKERLSGRGKIDLVDFSIIAYYWTG